MTTNNAWNSGTPVEVAKGGTGASTLTGVVTANGTSAMTANTVTQHGVIVGGASNAVGSTAVGTSGQVLTSNGAGSDPTFQTLSTGDVTGPGSSTDNAVVRWNGTGGNTVQDSGVIVDDSNNITANSINFGDQNLSVYKTGTFTPIVSGSSTAGTGTYIQQDGNYTQIGKLVFVQFYS